LSGYGGERYRDAVSTRCAGSGRRAFKRWLPKPRICHPYPLRRLGVIT